MDTGFGMEIEQVRMSSEEYRAAFKFFDSDCSGSVDMRELSRALQQVQQTIVSSTSAAAAPPRAFNLATCCWLCGRFGDGATALNETQFCHLLEYIKNVRVIFEKVDSDRNGSITGDELHVAFAASGVCLDPATVLRVGQSFDLDRSSALEFDEFVQMRLEWDTYIKHWQAATQGNPVIAPDKLLQVLEQIKRSFEPVGSAFRAAQSDISAFLHGLLHTSMFSKQQNFHPQTCETLIVHFGEGNLFLNFKQFCTLLVFLKEMKTVFCKLDTNGDGSLGCDELANAFANAGMALPPALVVQIGRSYDRDNSGSIEFDEFVQMAAEWGEVWKARSHPCFGADAAGRISPRDLQNTFGEVRVLYQVVNQAIVDKRSFSLNTCRWLCAKFGTPLAGETYAQGVTWFEFLSILQYLKECHFEFSQCDFGQKGRLNAQELAMMLARQGLNLDPMAIESIRRSFDHDGSGTLEFDEFLQVVMECSLFNKCFDSRLAQPSIMTPLNTVSPLLGQTFATAASAQGVITLDRSAFFAMVFALPRPAGG